MNRAGNQRTPEQPKVWPQYLVLFVACLTHVGGGAIFAWASPSISKLGEYNITVEAVSYVILAEQMTVVAFAPVYGILVDYMGRKYILIQSGIAEAVSFILFASYTHLYIIYSAKIVHGIGAAAYFCAMPLYLTEITSPKVRNVVGNIMSATGSAGQFLMNCVGFYFSLRAAALSCLCVPIIFLCSFPFMPESPYYLVMKGRFSAAEKSLKFLTRLQDVSGELEVVKHGIRTDKGRLKDLVMKAGNRKALFITIWLRGVQQLSGFMAFAAYCAYMFELAGGDLASGHAAMIFTAMTTLTQLGANVFSRRFGRRFVIAFSGYGCTFLLYTECIYFYVKSRNEDAVVNMSWYPVSGLCVYVLFYSLGLGPIPNVLVGELFPANMKRYAIILNTQMFAMYLMLAPKLFQLMASRHGLAVPFLFFGICTFIGTTVSFFILPETKDKTLDQIQRMLNNN